MKQEPTNNQDFELLWAGSNDKINLLSDDELEELVWGKYWKQKELFKLRPIYEVFSIPYRHTFRRQKYMVNFTWHDKTFFGLNLT